VAKIIARTVDNYRRSDSLKLAAPQYVCFQTKETAEEIFMSEPIKEIDVLWITAGLGCDGDTIAITAATQPSLEDIVRGIIPGIPKVRFHNPVLAYENGEAFMQFFHDAADGKIAPFILVVEGSIPNEKNKAEGYWAAFGIDRVTGQPIPTCEWINRLAPKAWAVVTAGTCAAYGGIHAMAGNPTGAMGLADYLGWDWKSKTGIPIVNVPGCPVQPDNFMETLLYLFRQAAGTAPMIPLDEAMRPAWLFSDTAHEVVIAADTTSKATSPANTGRSSAS
jgi:hydrogenase small subunit